MAAPPLPPLRPAPCGSRMHLTALHGLPVAVSDRPLFEDTLSRVAADPQKQSIPFLASPWALEFFERGTHGVRLVRDHVVRSTCNGPGRVVGPSS